MKVALVIVSIVAVLAVAALAVVLATGWTITDDETAASEWTSEESRWFVDRCVALDAEDSLWAGACAESDSWLQENDCTPVQGFGVMAAVTHSMEDREEPVYDELFAQHCWSS